MTILVITDKCTCQTEYGQSDMLIGECRYVADKDAIVVCDRKDAGCRLTGVDEEQLARVLTEHYLAHDYGIDEIHLPRITDNLFDEARLQKMITESAPASDGKLRIIHI